MIEKIDEVKMKLINVIEKNLDKGNLTSRELFDYAQILSNLKSAEQYKDTMEKAFNALGYSNGFNGNGGLISN